MTRVHCPCGSWNDADLVRSCLCGRVVRGLSGFPAPGSLYTMEREARRLASSAGLAEIDAVFAAHEAGVPLTHRRAA
ncbi:hypothetical protein EON79_21970 [bacterium]|nr:MAG: hypothetical protein EON79_21970 [bacterium]